jgi:hypothetical protein
MTCGCSMHTHMLAANDRYLGGAPHRVCACTHQSHVRFSVCIAPEMQVLSLVCLWSVSVLSLFCSVSVHTAVPPAGLLQMCEHPMSHHLVLRAVGVFLCDYSCVRCCACEPSSSGSLFLSLLHKSLTPVTNSCSMRKLVLSFCIQQNAID